MLLGYSEEEVWEMTIGKLMAMLTEHRKEHGMIIEDTHKDVEKTVAF